MLVGLNVSISYLAGSILAWYFTHSCDAPQYHAKNSTDGFRGIIGPMLVARGQAFGSPATDVPEWSALMTYNSLSNEFTTPNHPSPRYWLLWPGVSCMIAVSMTGKDCIPLFEGTAANQSCNADLLCQWRIFWLTSKVVYNWIANGYRALLTHSPGKRYVQVDSPPKTKGSEVQDFALDDEIVQLWMWLPGLVAVLVLTCIVMRSQFGMPILETLLALFLAFFFSFLAIQATGATGQ